MAYLYFLLPTQRTCPVLAANRVKYSKESQSKKSTATVSIPVLVLQMNNFVISTSRSRQIRNFHIHAGA